MKKVLYLLALVILGASAYFWLRPKEATSKATNPKLDSIFRATYIEQKDYFKVEDLYFKHKDELSPIWRELYEAERLSFRNQHEESNKRFADWLKAYSFKHTYAKTNSYITSAILQNLIRIENEEDFDVWYKILWKSLPKIRADLQAFKTLFELKKKIRIDRGIETQSIPLETDDSGMLKAKIKINNITTDAVLDTGLSYCTAMTKSIADKLGVRIYEKSLIKVNHCLMQGGKGIIDSLEIGGIKIYNIPVTIIDSLNYDSLPDSIKQNPKKMKKARSEAGVLNTAIIGYPILELIGKLEFDFEQKTLSFPQYKRAKAFKKLLGSKPMNLMKKNNALFIQMELEHNPITLDFDTGCGYLLCIYDPFYKAHKESFTLDSMRLETIHTMHKIEKRNIKYLKTPLITYEGKELKVKTNKDRVITDYDKLLKSTTFKSDGLMGYPALRAFGKRVLLDLDNVQIQVLEP